MGPFVKAVSGNKCSALLTAEGRVCRFGEGGKEGGREGGRDGEREKRGEGEREVEVVGREGGGGREGGRGGWEVGGREGGGRWVGGREGGGRGEGRVREGACTALTPYFVHRYDISRRGAGGRVCSVPWGCKDSGPDYGGFLHTGCGREWRRLLLGQISGTAK